MEKRLVLFSIISLTIIIGYPLLLTLVFPPPPRALPKQQPKVVQNEDGGPQDLLPEDEPLDDGRNDDGEARDDRQSPDKDSPSIDAPDDSGESSQDDDAWQPPGERRRIALGTLAPESSYRYLATFDTLGASIRRVELNERTSTGLLRYRNVSDKSGYLANLALEESSDGAGCIVGLVGDGTPAALAKPANKSLTTGLKAGDEITAINDQSLKVFASELSKEKGRSVSTVTAFHDILKETKANQAISLNVRRNGTDARFTTELTRRPLEIIQPENSNGVDDPQSMLLTVGTWQDDKWQEISAAMRDANWEFAADQDGDGKIDLQSNSLTDENVAWALSEDTKHRPTIAFRFIVESTDASPARQLEVVKRYSLTPKSQKADQDRSYHVQMDVEIHNRGENEQSMSYQLDGPTGLPLEGWWYSYKVIDSWSAAGARDVVWSSLGRPGFLYWGCPTIFRNTTKEKPSNLFEPPPAGQREARTLRSVGGDTQYFCVIVQPAKDENPKDYAFVRGEARPVVPVSSKDKRTSKKVNTSFRLVSQSHPVTAMQPLKQRFVLFMGPKQKKLLERYGISDLTYYGWFAICSRPLVEILHWFYRVVGNYGVAIILLTVLVRGAMWPIGRKAAKNAQMMQVLAPEMKKIADRYKNDMEKRGRAQMELFRKYNYNPYSGCLLMFLQLPVFIGLYRGLSVDIGLRDQPLIPGIEWCSNLAGPDKLWYWEPHVPAMLASEAGWFGPYFNILPIITVVLFLVQQKLFTPPPTDEQQMMTHRMMSFMTIFIGVMFFKVPSGLCIYFITSSLWGIAERKLLPKPKLPDHLQGLGEDPTSSPAKPKPSPKPGTNGAERQRIKQRKRKSKKGKK